ncbi:hypothetical protein GCM10011409_42710 [Lentibacillus populi]|uniref:Uncharacterized protein n=1 Tax=Lentibacillus populi TaxID=1827502 RepID=A0A9W5X803_9BACI|nr:hypothetical protein GCM10011409_42710 [Lentibacillus populi]
MRSLKPLSQKQTEASSPFVIAYRKTLQRRNAPTPLEKNTTIACNHYTTVTNYSQIFNEIFSCDLSEYICQETRLKKSRSLHRVDSNLSNSDGIQKS